MSLVISRRKQIHVYGTRIKNGKTAFISNLSKITDIYMYKEINTFENAESNVWTVTVNKYP